MLTITCFHDGDSYTMSFDDAESFLVAYMTEDFVFDGGFQVDRVLLYDILLPFQGTIAELYQYLRASFIVIYLDNGGASNLVSYDKVEDFLSAHRSDEFDVEDDFVVDEVLCDGIDADFHGSIVDLYNSYA